MSVPPVDKIHEVPDDVWDEHFLSPELLRGLDIPMMDERAIEKFEKRSDDENKVVSNTTSTSIHIWLSQTITHSYVNCDSIMVVGFQLWRITDLFSGGTDQRNTHALW